MTNRFRELLDQSVKNGTQVNTFSEGAKEIQLLKEQLKATQKELNKIKKDLIEFEKNWVKQVLEEVK